MLVNQDGSWTISRFILLVITNYAERKAHRSLSFNTINQWSTTSSGSQFHFNLPDGDTLASQCCLRGRFTCPCLLSLRRTPFPGESSVPKSHSNSIL